MTTTKNPIVAPFYTFAATQLFFALIGMSFSDGYDVFASVFLGLIPTGIVAIVCLSVRAANRKHQPHIQTQTQHNNTSGNSEVDAVILECRQMLSQLEAVKSKIKNPGVIYKTNEIVDVSHKVLNQLVKEPELHSSVKRFSSYYLPTTIKLVTNYSNMEVQGIQGGNISATMEKIENALETLKTAYKSQLDSLFSHVAMDLETDIQVLENILKTEGLISNENIFDKGE